MESRHKTEYQDEGQSSLSLEQWQEWFNTSVCVVSEFRLISKLSGAGVVVRVLETPEGEEPWFGKQQSPTEWRIAQKLDSKDISPYQPIGVLTLEEVQSGTKVRIQWAPHRDVNILAVAELVGGILCIISGLVGLQSNSIAIGAILLGLFLVVFPRFRAQWNATRELERAREAIQQLPIEWT